MIIQRYAAERRGGSGSDSFHYTTQTKQHCIQHLVDSSHSILDAWVKPGILELIYLYKKKFYNIGHRLQSGLPKIMSLIFFLSNSTQLNNLLSKDAFTRANLVVWKTQATVTVIINFGDCRCA